MNKTKIDWCDSTWNPVTGCYHGCEYCYARNQTHRFGAGWETASENLPVLDEPVYGQRIGKDGKPETRKEAYPYDFIPTFHRYHLNDYIGKKGRNIFVCSMADLFGKWVPDEWIQEVFAACEKAPQPQAIVKKGPVQRRQRRSVGDCLLDQGHRIGPTGSQWIRRKSWQWRSACPGPAHDGLFHR